MIDSGPDICQSLVTLQILRCNVASLVGMAVLFVRPVASSRIIFFSYQGRTANKGILENSACIAGRLYSSLHCVAFSTSPAGSLRCVIVALVHWFVNPLLPQSFHCYFNPHLERLISISVMPTFRFFRFFSFHPDSCVSPFTGGQLQPPQSSFPFLTNSTRPSRYGILLVRADSDVTSREREP